MLPEQKTYQNNETFEHEWRWFLKASENEKVWLVEMHKPNAPVAQFCFNIRNIENVSKCKQRHSDKGFRKTNRNAQMLPEHKTDQNNDTFENKWHWFLKAPEREKVWLVEMHRRNA